MILIIILGVICCDLAFCQLDKSVLIIHYGDVNYYAENENYWAETNGRNIMAQLSRQKFDVFIMN